MRKRPATTRPTTIRPPAVPGTVGLRSIDALRVVWWVEVGFVHGASRGPLLARLYAGFMAIAWWACVPVLVMGQAVAVRRRQARYYLPPERDVVLAVVARPDGWHVTEHLAAKPGSGRGRALRAVVGPVLLEAADAHGITLQATSATRRLAEQYAATVPGTVDIGRGAVRGRRLQRPPDHGVETAVCGTRLQ